MPVFKNNKGQVSSWKTTFPFVFTEDMRDRYLFLFSRQERNTCVPLFFSVQGSCVCDQPVLFILSNSVWKYCVLLVAHTLTDRSTRDMGQEDGTMSQSALSFHSEKRPRTLHGNRCVSVSLEEDGLTQG